MKNGRRLTDKLVRSLPIPVDQTIDYDAELPGFGIRVTPGGARAFVLRYRTRTGRDRLYTIGGFPGWQTAAARKFAGDLKARIRQGHDPLAELEAERAAPTIARLCDRFEADYLDRLRPATAEMYRLLINGPKPQPKRGKRRDAAFEGLRKAWGSHKVEDIAYADVATLHARVSRKSGYMANRLISLVSRLFALAIRWGWRTTNPAKGIERNDESKRQRFLAPEEIGRLTEALAVSPDQQAANIVRLLALTGARRGEVLGMRWADLDLTAGVWTKMAHTTKQRTEHRVPLSAAARALLAGLPRAGDWVFPGVGGAGHRENIKSSWPKICAEAGLLGPDGRPSVRIHDLRHTFASLLASAGLSLPIIGALLGHSQPATTARYSHLLDDALRAATERVAAVVTGAGEGAEVVPFGGRP